MGCDGVGGWVKCPLEKQRVHITIRRCHHRHTIVLNFVFKLNGNSKGPHFCSGRYYFDVVSILIGFQ